MISPAVQEIVKFRAAFGQLEVDELTSIAENLIAFPWENDNFIVEIGTYKGRTPVMMARALTTIGRRPKIVSIDAFDRVTPTRWNCRGSYDETIKNILAAGLGAQCVVVSGFSDDVAPLIPSRAAALIVDGWHSLEQASSDLRNYFPKLVPGGFAMVDDYCNFYPGVIQAVDEFVASGNSGVVLEKKLNKGVILRRG
jgi:hypothetical protein